MDAVRDAGLTQVDHLILTHYHADHFGGMEELSKRIPIREFIDHGPNVQPGAGADWERDVYPKLLGRASTLQSALRARDDPIKNLKGGEDSVTVAAGFLYKVLGNEQWKTKQ